jgi:hypothetical protein
MKRALFTILIFACLSCKKEKSYCWKCTTKVIYYPSSIGGNGTSNNTVCDKTQDEIDNYEKAATSTTTSSSGGITVTIKHTTTCVKQ